MPNPHTLRPQRFDLPEIVGLSSLTMPKHSSTILELAARGARARYEELQTELSSLVRHFPKLRDGVRGAMNRGRRAVEAAATELQRAPRKRRKMSAAARAKIAAAQRARWAKYKQAAEATAGGARKAGKKR
jgi:hypothetical protein